MKPVGLMWACCFLLLSLSSHADGQKFQLMPSRSKLEFVSHGVPIIGPEFEVNGHFEKWNVTATLIDQKSEKVEVFVSIDMRSIKTGIARRDKHLKSSDFFWVERYPNASFTLQQIAKTNEPQVRRVTGVFELRGLKKEISFLVKFDSETIDQKTNYHFVGSLPLNRQDFGISYQSSFFVIPKVKDEAEVRFDIWLGPMAE